jgi:hypothetical protein
MIYIKLCVLHKITSKMELMCKLFIKEMLLEKAVWDCMQSKRVKGEKIKKSQFQAKSCGMDL